MADLAKSAVTILEDWSDHAIGNRRVSYRKVQLVLTGQGDATDDIKAGVLDLRTIEGCTPLQKSDDTAAYWGVPSYDGSKLYLYEDASDAPAVQTGTFRCIVWGQG